MNTLKFAVAFILAVAGSIEGGFLPAAPGITYTKAIPYNVPPFASSISIFKTFPRTQIIAPSPALVPPFVHHPQVAAVAPAPIVPHLAPAPAAVVPHFAPAVPHFAPAPAAVVPHVAAAPVVPHLAPAPVVPHFAPAPVVPHFAPAPVVPHFAAPAPVVPQFAAAVPAVYPHHVAAAAGPAYYPQFAKVVPQFGAVAAPVPHAFHPGFVAKALV